MPRTKQLKQTEKDKLCEADQGRQFLFTLPLDLLFPSLFNLMLTIILWSDAEVFLLDASHG